ncbi:MAG: efflux RND transporter permease subunit, partial [Bacteroidaceae bacterium]|nr:efflux RND transporter permease subunit [Bacteroidaceae bacterium]
MNFVINRRITICMLFIAFSMLGYISYKQLAIELLPNAELPQLYVNVSSQSDVNPSYMEQQAIIPIEGAISGIDGVENIESTASNRNGSVRVDFKKNVNFKYTTLKLQEKINEVAKTLPDGFSVNVQKVSVNQTNNNFMSLQVKGSGGVDRIRNIVDEEIVTELENVDGVASVSVYGGREKAIEIQLDPDACKALNITASRISSLLSQNAQDKTFVGYVTEPNGQYFVHVNSTYSKVADIENVVVSSGPVLLKDIATIFFDLKDETSYSRIDGKEVISVTLVNDAQSNLIELSHRTLEKIDELNQKLVPYDVEIIVQNNNAQIIEDNVNQITE